MKKKWLTALTAALALTFCCGLAACGGCSSCDTNSDASSETQSSSVAGSIAESSEEEMSSSETKESSEEVESSEAEESSEFTTSPMFSSLEDVESSETEESAEIVESSEEDSFVEEESSSETEESTEIVESSEEIEDSSVEESSSEEEKEEKTDEEIFAEIKAAVLATQNYNGAFSMHFKMENASNGDEGYEMGYFTYNPETLEHALGGSDEINITKEKIFIKDGKYYLYYANGTEAELEESQTCTEKSLPNVVKYQDNYTDYYAPWTMMGELGSFAIADTHAELVDAFTVVTANSLAAMQAEGFVNAIGNYAIDLGVEDGKSWITFTTTFACDEEPYDGGKNYQSQMTYKFVVENGYVAYIEQNYYGYADEEWGVEERNMKAVYEYVYAFDKEYFDSLTACEIQEKTEYLLNVALHVHPNYTENRELSITAETKAEDILNRVNGYLFWVSPENLNLEMDAWYLDEACTVKFDPNTITDLMESENITDLYVKSITFSPDYAWVIVENKAEKHYSKPYQIVAMFDFNGRGVASSIPFCLINKPYTLPHGDKVLVDGVETTAESITLEAGKTYVITRIEYEEDSDYWLFA